MHLTEKNKHVYCPAPFHEQMVDSDGSIKLCCTARHAIRNDDGTEANITSNTLEEVWNNKHMQEIRQNMIDGVKPANDMCENCYASEKHSGVSSRQNELTEMNEIREELNEYVDTAIVEDLPDYYDLRFGNLCNLQCVMCDPHYSSRLMTEQEKILDLLKNNLEHINYELEKKYKEYYVWNKGEPEKYSWPANNDIFNSIVDRMAKSNCRKVYVNGGEPTLHNESLTNMLNTLIESGQASDIELWLNTNATIVDTNFYELLDEFKQIRLMLSIDGIEESFEYIRNPAKWNIVDSNIKKIINCVRNFENLSWKWRIEFHPTFQLLNLLDIDKMIEYWLDIRKDLPCYFNPVKLNDPSWYDVTIANTNIKNEIKKKLQSKFSSGDEELAKVTSYIISNLEHQEADIENDRELLLRCAEDMHEIYRKTRNIEHLDGWFKSTINQLK